MRKMDVQMTWDEQYPGWVGRSTYTHFTDHEDGAVGMRDITFRSTDGHSNPMRAIVELVELTAREADIHPSSLTAVVQFPGDDLYDNRNRYF